MSDWHVTLRHFAYIAAGLLAFFVLMGRLFPAPPAHYSTPTVVFTPSPAEREIQALIEADKVLAQSRNLSIPVLQQPAVTVLKESGLVNGLSSAQVAQILSALKPKTVEAVAVHTVVKAPTPAPTPSDPVYQHVFDAAYAADTKALSDTTIKTTVDITRQEVPPSRVGSLLAPNASGLSYAVWRHKQIEAELAAVSVGSHIAPAVCGHYLIPRTTLSVGPCIVGPHFNFAAVVHF